MAELTPEDIIKMPSVEMEGLTREDYRRCSLCMSCGCMSIITLLAPSGLYTEDKYYCDAFRTIPEATPHGFPVYLKCPKYKKAV